MAEQNNGKNNYQVSTGLISMFDPEGVLLRMNGMDSSLGITIITPVTDASGKRTYPKDNKEARRFVLLTYDRVLALYDRIVAKLIPAINDRRSMAVGVMTNRDKTNMLELRYEAETNAVVLVYYTGIDMELRAKDNVAYQFQQVLTVEGYEPADLSKKPVADEVHAQFLMFAETLHGYSLMGGNGVAGHSANMGLHYINERLHKYMLALAAGLHVTLPTGGFFSGGGNGGSGMGNLPTAQPIADPAMTTINNPDDFLN